MSRARATLLPTLLKSPGSSSFPHVSVVVSACRNVPSCSVETDVVAIVHYTVLVLYSASCVVCGILDLLQAQRASHGWRCSQFGKLRLGGVRHAPTMVVLETG